MVFEKPLYTSSSSKKSPLERKGAFPDELVEREWHHFFFVQRKRRQVQKGPYRSICQEQRSIHESP